MYVAMNRFEIALGKEVEFETVWRTRESRLHERPGFLGFLLLRGPTKTDRTLYASHTTWASRADFDAWVGSEQFVDAHRNAHRSSALMIAPNVFEGFDVVHTLPAPGEAEPNGAAA